MRGKRKKASLTRHYSIVQESQPGLTAGEEKGQLLLTFAVAGERHGDHEDQKVSVVLTETK